MLFSQSADGVTWSKAALLFPSMDTASTPSAQFAGPFAVLNGRLYASASPAVIADGDAQGAQYCQFPDGLDPRNCNCPGVKHDRLQATLLPVDPLVRDGENAQKTGGNGGKLGEYMA